MSLYLRPSNDQLFVSLYEGPVGHTLRTFTIGEPSEPHWREFLSLWKA